MSFQVQWFNLNPGLSDHSPLLLEVGGNDLGGGRPFQLFKHMITHPEFLVIVSRVWSLSRPQTLKQIWYTIKEMKKDIKGLHSSEF